MKWLRIGRIFFVLVLTLAMNCRLAENVPVMLADPLASALQATGAEAGEVSINAWGRLPVKPADEAALTRIVKQAMHEFGIDDTQVVLNQSTSRYQRMVRAEMTDDNSHLVVIAEELYPGGQTQAAEVYLVINLETRQYNEAAVVNSKAKISRIMAEFDGIPQITTCLVGWLDGKLMKDEQDRRLGDAFDAIEAKTVSSTTTDQYVSSTGMSPLIQQKLQVGNDQININMAMRYSPLDNRTYVIIGSPVITLEY